MSIESEWMNVLKVRTARESPFPRKHSGNTTSILEYFQVFRQERDVFHFLPASKHIFLDTIFWRSAINALVIILNAIKRRVMGEYLKLMRFYKMKKKFLKIYLIKTGHINCSIMKMRCEVLHFSVDEHSIRSTLTLFPAKGHFPFLVYFVRWLSIWQKNCENWEKI